MKNTHVILLTLILVLALAACATPSTASTPSSAAASRSSTRLADHAVVSFSDPVLEEMVRGALGLPEGDIPLTQAQAVTRLDLSNPYPVYFPPETSITDLSGLENFTGLQSLDLSDQAITDLSPLAGLTNLTDLSLAANPVTDISPLAGLTNLKLLILSGSQAQNYDALANLVNLQVLLLDNSTITDLSPLAALTNLRHLHLENCVLDDMSPIVTLYPNLESKDFTIATTLAELGFSMNTENHEATYGDESLYVTINHSSWGSPPNEQDLNSIRISLPLKDGYILKAIFHPEIDAYAIGMGKDGEMVMNYSYDVPTGIFTFEEGDRASSEQAVRAAFDVVEGEDILLAPIRSFNESIKNTFARSVNAIYALPYAPPTLKNLGFFADQPNAVYLYDYRGENITDNITVEVHRPEWGEQDYDVRFYASLSEEYRIVVTWHAAEQKIIASVDDNDQGGAKFFYFIETGEFIDDWCSYPDLTVEEYFIQAYNDPSITDVYQHSVDMMTNYVSDTFGMTVEELYALPTGE